MEFKCEKCEEGKVSDDAYNGGGLGLECVCKPGYKNLYDTNLSIEQEGYEIVIGCEACTAGTAPSRDKRKCLPCDSSMTSNDPSEGLCSCPEG